MSFVRSMVLLITCVFLGNMIGCSETAGPQPPEAAPVTKNAKGKDLPKGAVAAESPF